MSELTSRLQTVSEELWSIEDAVTRQGSSFSVGAIMGAAATVKRGRSFRHTMQRATFGVIAPTINIRVLPLFKNAQFFIDRADPIKLSRARHRLDYYRSQTLPAFEHWLAGIDKARIARVKELEKLKSDAQKELQQAPSEDLSSPDKPAGPMSGSQTVPNIAAATRDPLKDAHLRQVVTDVEQQLAVLADEASRTQLVRNSLCQLLSHAVDLEIALERTDATDGSEDTGASVDQRSSDESKRGADALRAAALTMEMQCHLHSGLQEAMRRQTERGATGSYLGPHAGIGYGVVIGPDGQEGRASGIIVTVGVGWAVGSAGLLDIGLFATQHGAFGINVGLGAYVFERD